jgi:hypothetical protein
MRLSSGAQYLRRKYLADICAAGIFKPLQAGYRLPLCGDYISRGDLIEYTRALH